MDIRQDGIASNSNRLLWAGFAAIVATGVGFGVRGGILANWGAEFGFTNAELGAITGAGPTGFCFGVIIGGTIVDKGTLEAVANPLIATLFPEKRTHYLNILHASWPAGLVAGGAIGWILGEHYGWHWKWQLGLFLIPTLLHGVMFYG
jgi:MFS family permease